MPQHDRRDDRERAIRDLAYSLWEREGYPHGREHDHWLQAEAHVSAADETPERKPAPAKAKATAKKAAAAKPKGRAAAAKPAEKKKPKPKKPT